MTAERQSTSKEGTNSLGQSKVLSNQDNKATIVDPIQEDKNENMITEGAESQENNTI